MQGRSPEFLPTETEPTDDGFSEEKLAKAAEGGNTDDSSLKKRKPAPANGARMRPIRLSALRKPVVPVSRKEKILAVYTLKSQELTQLAQSVSLLSSGNLRQEEQLIEEITSKRKIADELLTALLLEQKGQLTEESISKEAWNLIQ